MARCDHCKTTILFGGERAGGRRYCNTECRDSDLLGAAKAQIPAGFAEEKAS